MRKSTLAILVLASGWMLAACDSGPAEEALETPADTVAAARVEADGHLLKAVLDAAPSASGVLFDLQHVIEEVSGMASKRLSLQAGDFFDDPLPTCDAYLLMEVIHDWGDEQAIAILKALRSAAPSHAKILLIEQLVPPTPGPDWAKTLDIHMLFLLGGRQRTGAEYEDLFHKAGFSMQREIDAAGGVSILEAIPA